MLRYKYRANGWAHAREGGRPHESRQGVQEKHTACATDRARSSRAPGSPPAPPRSAGGWPALADGDDMLPDAGILSRWWAQAIAYRLARGPSGAASPWRTVASDDPLTAPWACRRSGVPARSPPPAARGGYSNQRARYQCSVRPELCLGLKSQQLGAFTGVTGVARAATGLADGRRCVTKVRLVDSVLRGAPRARETNRTQPNAHPGSQVL
jgi:hypothetical protein